ncbi:hypothetical protein EDM56_02435 [Brevibacillus fluminis]|uniref:Uncharacterized protein n=1 Tax=Brevibacillus fluminis TaxID=511487 RepID=A0A3M8DU60_9BACL|nr:hypothetical protein EDM56_02435 [Brevibacillus fluminis]
MVDYTQQWQKPFTDQQVRRRLDMLEKRGYIVKSRGRFGTKLTQAGLQLLQDTEKNKKKE